MDVRPPIKSYVYKKNSKQQEIIIESTAGIENVETIDNSKLIPPSTKTSEDNNTSNKTSEALAAKPDIPTSEVVKIDEKVKSPPKAIFNPYEIMISVNKELDQSMIDEVVMQKNKVKGISELQGRLPNVPIRKYVKSSLQKREEATTIIGNETFIKLNGTCAQSTDLSFIDEDIGSVTSYSDCGETDDEKYFREFMEKRLEK